MIEALKLYFQIDLNVVLTLTAAIALMGRCDEKRSHVIWRLVISQVIMMLLCIGMNELRSVVPRLVGEFPLRSWVNIGKYVLILAFAILLTMFCFKYPIGQAMLNAASAYCIEHIAQRTKGLIMLAHPCTKGNEIMLIYMVTALYMLLFYLLIRKKSPHGTSGNSHIDKVQILVPIAVACGDIVFSLRFIAEVARTGAESLSAYGYLASIMFSVLTLVISQCHLIMSQEAYEKDMVKRLLHEEKAMYTREQTTVDVLNIKAHDLKHRLSELDSRLNPEEIEDLKKAVDDYDVTYHTGNSSLDVVITNKALLCQGLQVHFTCLADGSTLSFMQEWDIYSLFGNIIDNAINAAENVEDPEYRMIGLTVSRSNGLVVIHEENYYAGKLIFSDGLPQTGQEHKMYHGFGLKSIRTLLEKYGGHMNITADNQLFALDILIPIPQAEA